MDNPTIHCEECSRAHGVPTLHASDSHALGAISGYNRQPKGIPTISHMNEDFSFTIVAAGYEQVERYQKANSSAEYLAGEEAIEREGKT